MDYYTKLEVMDQNSTTISHTVDLKSYWPYQDVDIFKKNLTINSSMIFAGKDNTTLVEGRMLLCYIGDSQNNNNELMLNQFV